MIVSGPFGEPMDARLPKGKQMNKVRKPVSQPKLLPDHEWCATCGGEGTVWVGRGPVEREEQCEECDGECQVQCEETSDCSG